MSKNYFHLAFALAWLLVITMSVFTNIYADEPAFRVYNSRQIVDGGDIVGNLYGYNCPSAEQTELPSLLMPARLISSTFWTTLSGSRAHRIIGVGTYSFLLLLIFLLSMNVSKIRETRFEPLLYLSILPIVLGANPFNLVSTRPEIFILINLFIFIFLITLNLNTSIKKNLAAALILLLSHFFFLLHPKTLLFLPFLIFLIMFVLKGCKKYLVTAALIYLGTLSIFSYKLHTGRLVCSENQLALDIMHSINLTPRLLFSEPSSFIVSGVKNLNIAKYFRHLVFSDSYQSDWLILYQNKFLYCLGWGINVFICLSLFGLVVLTLKIFTETIKKKKVTLHNKALVSSLFVGIFGMCFLQKAKFFYETPLFFSLTLALLLLCLITDQRSDQLKVLERFKWIMPVVRGTAFISLLFLGLNTFNRAVLNDEELGIGMPTFTQSYSSMDEGFKKIANSCQLDKTYPSGTVYVDTLGFYYAYNQPNLRIINFANALQEMDRIREKNETLFSAPAISLFLGECKWLEKLENRMNVLDTFNIKDRRFCCAIPQ